MKTKETKRRGAPPKVGTGAKRVLLVRVDEVLVQLLDQRVALLRSRQRGQSVSRAGVVRNLLFEGLAKST